jgi:hypothetical protein
VVQVWSGGARDRCMDVWSKSTSWARLKKYQDLIGQAYEEIEKALVHHKLDLGLN